LALPEKFIEDLVARCDIVEIVSRYVALNKRTGSNLFGLCPFHNEKSPSFSVRPDRQMFHCFGCGKGGGVIRFIMDIENLDFLDAVRFLADLVGMSVPQDDEDLAAHRRRTEALSAAKTAAKIFYENLRTPEGVRALEYIRKRELSPETVKRFGLGYSLDTWDSLVNELRKRGFSDAAILDADLASTNKYGKLYDRFRGRLMFPIIDLRGNVIAFGARVLDDSLPKYLNSKDSFLYNKNRHLYAMNITKKTTAKQIILAEGYMDVIALHQAGFDNAVASLGTALTEEQVNLLSRYTGEIAIAYDSDGPGRNATERAIGLLKKANFDIKVLNMTGAKDPDEFIKKNGREAFERLLNGSASDLEYKLSGIKKKYDLGVDDQRVRYLRETIESLADVRSSVTREIYAGRLAEDTGVTKEAILAEIAREYKKREKSDKRKYERAAMDIEKAMQPRQHGHKFENIRSATCEKALIGAVYDDPSILSKIDAKISADEFSAPEFAKIYSIVCQRIRDGKPMTAELIEQELDMTEMDLFSEILSSYQRSGNASQEIEDYIETIRIEHTKSGEEKSFDEILKAYRDKKGNGGSNNGR